MLATNPTLNSPPTTKVSATAISFCFHHGRAALASYAMSSASISDENPPDAVHIVPRRPTPSNPPLVGLKMPFNVSLTNPMASPGTNRAMISIPRPNKSGIGKNPNAVASTTSNGNTDNRKKYANPPAIAVTRVRLMSSYTFSPISFTSATCTCHPCLWFSSYRLDGSAARFYARRRNVKQRGTSDILSILLSSFEVDGRHTAESSRTHQDFVGCAQI